MQRLATLVPVLLLVACGDDGGSDDSSAAASFTVGMSWQIQFSGTLDTSLDVQLYDLDLFDTPDDVFASVKDQGALLVCYFSAGSFEDWRDDASGFPTSALGNPLEGWKGEWWVDVRDPTVREIMAARMDHAVERGCDAVDPDNVDGWANDNGLGFTAADQLDYNTFLATEAHARRLGVGLKNDLDQVLRLVSSFDFSVNEECLAYDECAMLHPFIDAGKPVLHIEYVDAWSDASARADDVCGQEPDFSTLVKTWDLGPEYLDCTDGR
jgi:hypothetical protein